MADFDQILQQYIILDPQSVRVCNFFYCIKYNVPLTFASRLLHDHWYDQ